MGENFSNVELSGEAVCVTGLPDSFYEHLVAGVSNQSFYADPFTKVEAGAPLFYDGGYEKYKAPVRGVFIGTVHHLDGDSFSEFAKKFGFAAPQDSEKKLNLELFFAPFSGERSDLTAADFYNAPSVIQSIQKRVNPSWIRSQFEHDPDLVKKLALDLTKFRTKKLLKVPFGDLPLVSRDVELSSDQLALLRALKSRWPSVDQPPGNDGPGGVG